MSPTYKSCALVLICSAVLHHDISETSKLEGTKVSYRNDVRYKRGVNYVRKFVVGDTNDVRHKRGINLIRQFAFGGAAYLRGEIVTGHLLRGTRKIKPPKGKNYAVFLKPGGFAKAKDDFYSIKPHSVRVDEHVKGMKDFTVYTGYAGDRTIYLYTWNPQYKQPIITISHATERDGPEIFSTIKQVIRYTQ